MIGQTASRCSTCSRLRWFLTCAGAVIVALYLQPDWAVRISGLVPSPIAIGLGICGLGSVGFGVGLWRMRRAQDS
jgi:hypothetical protein